MLVRLLRTYLRRYRPLLLVLVGLQGVQALAGLYLPFLNADVIDKGVMRGDTGYIWRMGGFMLGVTAVQLIFTVLAVYLGSRVAMGFGRDVRDALFHRVTGFSAREMNRFGAPSLITRITNDVQQVQMLVVMTANLALAAPVTVVGGIILAVHQDGGLAWLLAVSMPVLILAMGSVVFRMVPTFRVMQERIDGINKVLREQITGIRVVRAFVREREETARFEGANHELTTTSLTGGRLMALMFPIVMMVINGSSVAVIWFGGDRIADGSLSIGALIAFLSYFVLILMSVMMTTFVASMAPRAAVCADRIQEVLSTDSSVWAPTSPVEGLATLGSVEFSHVTFRYPGAEAPVLSDVSFATPAGTTTAIIGSTGAGKTTIVNLIARFYDAAGGTVRIDGMDIRTLDTGHYREQIGMVLQDPYLFHGTVLENIRYGLPGASLGAVVAAAKAANAHDFICKLGQGYDTVVGERGHTLSGGERQRISIARAILHDPRILILDEATSSVDTETEREIQEALERLITGRTVFAIAHRLSTLRRASRLFVIEEGRLAEAGTHRELLAKHDGIYRRLYEMQLQLQ